MFMRLFRSLHSLSRCVFNADVSLYYYVKWMWLQVGFSHSLDLGPFQTLQGREICPANRFNIHEPELYVSLISMNQTRSLRAEWISPPDGNRMLCGSGSVQFCWVLLGSVQFCWVLLGSVQFCWVLLGSVGFCLFSLLSLVFVCPVRFLLDFNFCGLWHSDYFVDGKK